MAMSAMLMPSLRVYGSEMAPPSRLIDGHTAGGLPKGSVGFDIKVYATRDNYGSGLIAGLQAGVSDRLTFGLSYGGEGVIGYSSDVRWYSLPDIGAMIKYRIFDETYLTPAVAIGFDNQGFGGLANEAEFGYNGYVYKSPGFFLAASKNFIMLNAVQIGFHGTLNYSLDDLDNASWPNFLVGFDLGINNELMLVMEYNCAFDDLTGKYGDPSYGNPFRGFLNFGLRWAFSPNFHLQFDMKDVLENKQRRSGSYIDENGIRRWNWSSVGWSRELRVGYVAQF
jgi:hypothetical protein